MKAIAVVIPRVLPVAMADRFVRVAPFGEAGVDAVLVGIDQRAGSDRSLDQGLNRLLKVSQRSGYRGVMRTVRNP